MNVCLCNECKVILILVDWAKERNSVSKNDRSDGEGHCFPSEAVFNKNCPLRKLIFN